MQCTEEDGILGQNSAVGCPHPLPGALFLSDGSDSAEPVFPDIDPFSDFEPPGSAFDEPLEWSFLVGGNLEPPFAVGTIKSPAADHGFFDDSLADSSPAHNFPPSSVDSGASGSVPRTSRPGTGGDEGPVTVVARNQQQPCIRCYLKAVKVCQRIRGLMTVANS
jgi:hypothetical protein